MTEDTDGSICDHISVAWIKINFTYQLSEEQRVESGNHAPELSEMTVIIGVKMGKSGLKWCGGRNIRVRGKKAKIGFKT